MMADGWRPVQISIGEAPIHHNTVKVIDRLAAALARQQRDAHCREVAVRNEAALSDDLAFAFSASFGELNFGSKIVRNSWQSRRSRSAANTGRGAQLIQR